MTGSTDKIDGEYVVRRMEAIRSVSESHVADLRQEAQRMVDWREHVRSKPLLSAAVAVVAGWTLVRGLVPRRAQRYEQPGRSAAVSPDYATESAFRHSVPIRKAPVRSMAAGAMAFVVPIASQVLRSFVLKTLRDSFGSPENDRHASERPSYVEKQ
jgi:hypothetical protein